MLQFSVTVFLTMATFAAFGKQEYIGTWPTVLATLSLFLLYGTASTALPRAPLRARNSDFFPGYHGHKVYFLRGGALLGLLPVVTG